MMLVRKILRVIKYFVKMLIYIYRWDQWVNRSWSQEGEDLILRRIFEKKTKGFYIDVGAHHPKRLSNTFLFYELGWHGINIDALPGSQQLFDKMRPADINIEIGIAEEDATLNYYIFNEPALNGFSKDLSEERDSFNTEYKILDIKKIKVLPLSYVLNSYLPDKQVIDFMTIDVEGLDLEVLKSNDWTKYRPKYVLVEVLNESLVKTQSSPIGRFMSDVGYEIYCKSANTVFFKEG